MGSHPRGHPARAAWDSPFLPKVISSCTVAKRQPEEGGAEQADEDEWLVHGAGPRCGCDGQLSLHRPPRQAEDPVDVPLTSKWFSAGVWTLTLGGCVF